MPVKPLRIISLGLGVQSTALYFASSRGDLNLPRADYAIFADPGKERTATYEYLDYLVKWQKENDGIPLVIARGHSLYKDLLSSEKKRFPSIPAFTPGLGYSRTGMLRRQCTNEYKIAVVDFVIRELYNLEKYARRPKTEVWMGITMDEYTRCSIPRDAWKINVFPFVQRFSTKKDLFNQLEWGVRLTRSEIIAYLDGNNLYR